MSNSFDANSPSPTSAGSDLPHFSSKNILLIAILVISVVLILLIFIFGLRLNPFQSLTQPKSGNTTNTVSGTLEMKKFNSEQEFKDYLQQSQQSGSVGIFNFGTGRAVTDLAIPQQGFAQPFSAKEEAPAADRFSQTNVQVKGIDEPDIVKTDGKNIFYSANFQFSPLLRMDPIPFAQPEAPVSKIMPPTQSGETSIITAFPPEDLAKTGKIDKTGEILLNNNVLVVFAGQNIYGYDVSQSNNPVQKWSIDLSENNVVVSSRLFNNKVYLVTQNYLNFGRPCPLEPLSISGSKMTIPCGEIYYPVISTPTDVTYTAFVIDPNSGRVENKVSFVGSTAASVIYVSPKALYVTYSIYPDMFEFMFGFYLESGQDLVNEEVLSKLRQLQSYDISAQSKINELNMVVERYLVTLNEDERNKRQNEIQNRLSEYTKGRLRQLEGTGIVKIDINSLAVQASGKIPGTLLNQFALDEYQDHLRVASTIGQGGFGSSESVNDVYILDKDLKMTGSAQDLGKGERIYSVRFIEDKGYVVTFKQIDPFYVLDLSDVNAPQVKGELKIPGFSSYLDPIAQNRILGVGQENSRIKLSLFDVSNPQNPQEVGKYLMDEYWTEVSSNHHAFLKDDKHQIFFLPSSKGGYIFSYANDNLSLEKVVSNVSAQRALFINDYLYIIGADKIIIVNEQNFENVKQLSF